jgi:hypothetical protein
MKPQKTVEELHEIIVGLVRANTMFNDVTPHKPYWHEPDKDGCNWDLSMWAGPALLVEDAAEFIRNDVLALRMKYDIQTT